MKEAKDRELKESNTEEQLVVTGHSVALQDNENTNKQGDEGRNANKDSSNVKNGGDGNILNELQENLTEIVDTIYQVHNICYKKLQDCYGKEPITLPINIEKVAEKLDIKIEYGNLNFGKKDKIDQYIAQLRYELGQEESEVIKTIVVDNSISKKEKGPLSNLEKYAVAYELGKMIVGKVCEKNQASVRKFNLKSKPYALPRLSARLENFEYELCAIFLLLPMELFFDEFQSYLKEIKDFPVLMDNWIQHLSEKAGIPNYQLINGYQYIKFSAYQYFKNNLSKEINGKDYRDLYNL